MPVTEQQLRDGASYFLRIDPKVPGWRNEIERRKAILRAELDSYGMARVMDFLDRPDLAPKFLSWLQEQIALVEPRCPCCGAERREVTISLKITGATDTAKYLTKLRNAIDVELLKGPRQL